MYTQLWPEAVPCTLQRNAQKGLFPIVAVESDLEKRVASTTTVSRLQCQQVALQQALQHRRILRGQDARTMSNMEMPSAESSSMLPRKPIWMPGWLNLNTIGKRFC